MTLAEGALTIGGPGPALCGLSHHQVLQRQDPTGCVVPVDLDDDDIVVHAFGGDGLAVATSQRSPDGRPTLWLPTGGPYDIVADAGAGRVVLATDVLVGDLWVMAGQSNIEGCARMHGGEQAGPGVRVFDMSGVWRLAQEPLHMKWLSPYPVHDRLQEERELEEAGKEPDPTPVVYHEGHVDSDEPSVNGRVLGLGPGVAFANELVRRRGVPIGLIPAAHGGSSMAQWSPALPEDGSTLFGAMTLSIRAAGGSIAGVLWYQGESESDTSREYTYDQELADLFTAMRERFGGPDLPIVVVQLGRYALPDREAKFDRLWSRLRESQRLCPAATATVPAVDLDLDDPIHIGTSGQVCLGRRLGRVAAGFPPVSLASVVTVRDGLAIDVRFAGVVGRLGAKGDRVSGFTVRSGAGEDQRLIFAAESLPEGDGFRLRLGRRLLPGEQLWYGYGADPFCNVVDDEDMGVPAFGPVELSVG